MSLGNAAPNGPLFQPLVRRKMKTENEAWTAWWMVAQSWSTLWMYCPRATTHKQVPHAVPWDWIRFCAVTSQRFAAWTTPLSTVYVSYQFSLQVNIKLSLCLSKQHAMKMYLGWRYSTTHSSPWPWKVVSGQLHALATLPPRRLGDLINHHGHYYLINCARLDVLMTVKIQVIFWVVMLCIVAESQPRRPWLEHYILNYSLTSSTFSWELCY